MYPILINWGPVVIPSWHFMYAAGAVAAFFFLRHLNGRLENPVENRQIANLFIACYIAGYFGARLLSIIVEQPELHSFDGILSGMISFGPMTFYGGAIASTFAGVIYAAGAKIPLKDVTDVSMPAGLLALAMGRIGCFLNGDDYGSVVTTNPSEAPWWAVVFPNMPDGLPRYPVQLWESAAVFLLVAVITLAFRRIRLTLGPGFAGFIAVAGYANLRFGLEFYRGDFRGSPFGGWMSTSQLISIVVLVVCVGCLPKLLKPRGKV
jgi:phosphatidylglycerol:prolipoprotein diacylglycerol transferase